MYSKSVCEGKCTGVLHLQENARFLVFKKTGDRPLSCVFVFLRKQGTEASSLTVKQHLVQIGRWTDQVFSISTCEVELRPARFTSGGKPLGGVVMPGSSHIMYN